MSDVSNGDLMNVLLDIKQDIGGLKTKADGHTAWMTKHVADDALMMADIRKLQDIGASQRGASRVWNTLGLGAAGVIGAVAGPVFSWLTGKH